MIVLWKNFRSDQSYLFFPLCFLLTEYLIQVDLEEEKESQEISALQEFEREDVRAKTVPQLLEMLSRPDQMPFYYCGGFEILSQAVTECEFSFERSFTKSSLSSNLFVLPNPASLAHLFSSSMANVALKPGRLRGFEKKETRKKIRANTHCSAHSKHLRLWLQVRQGCKNEVLLVWLCDSEREGRPYAAHH